MIRQVDPGAAAALAVIHEESFTHPWSDGDIADLLANPAAFALADEQGRGFVLAWSIAGEAEILTLAVRPAARRRGLATALVEAAAKEAEKFGARVLHLEVAEDNDAARALYASLGFMQVGARKGYYASAQGVNAIVMRRQLPL